MLAGFFDKFCPACVNYTSSETYVVSTACNIQHRSSLAGTRSNQPGRMTKMKLRLLTLLLVIFATSTILPAQNAPSESHAIPIKSRLELFVDDFLIDESLRRRNCVCTVLSGATWRSATAVRDRAMWATLEVTPINTEHGKWNLRYPIRHPLSNECHAAQTLDIREENELVTAVTAWKIFMSQGPQCCVSLQFQR